MKNGDLVRELLKQEGTLVIPVTHFALEYAVANKRRPGYVKIALDEADAAGMINNTRIGILLTVDRDALLAIKAAEEQTEIESEVGLS